MQSVSINVANQIKTELLENKVIQNQLRGKEKVEIELFFRNDKLQKMTYDEYSFTIGTSFDDMEDEEFEGVPYQVYENTVLLICEELKGLQRDWRYQTIKVLWDYDAKTEEASIPTFIFQNEIHFR